MIVLEILGFILLVGVGILALYLFMILISKLYWKAKYFLEDKFGGDFDEYD